MKVITESFLRETFRKDIPETFRVEEGQILTPSARQLLNEKKVKVVRGEEKAVASEVLPKKEVKSSEPIEYKPVHKYVTGDGGMFETKPEHMTKLQGNRLVSKDHPRILLRGKLDSLQSMILLAQSKAHESGHKKLFDDLSDVMKLSRAVMKADLLDEPLPESTLIGLTNSELRDQSENPEKFFGIDSFLPGFEMGEIILGLNQLRTFAREVEIMAVSAFRTEFELEKPDIIQALNKMSKAIYIMMLKEKAGKYQ